MLLMSGLCQHSQVLRHAFCEQMSTNTYCHSTAVLSSLPDEDLFTFWLYIQMNKRNYSLKYLVHLIYCLFGCICTIIFLLLSLSESPASSPHLIHFCFLYSFAFISCSSFLPYESYHFHYIASSETTEKSVKNRCKWHLIEKHLRFSLAFCMILKR